jgi:hypothetical protein
MALDKFQGMEHALNAPSHRWVTITPNNDADLTEVPKFLMIGGTTAGTIVCVGSDGVESTFYGEKGAKLEVRPHRIKATGTTASPIIACY